MGSINMIKKFLKSRLFYFILGAVIFSTSTTFAYSFLADDVEFTPTDTKWNVDNVSDALDYLKGKVNIEGNALTDEDVLDHLPKFYTTYYTGSLKATNGAYFSGGDIIIPKGGVQYGPYTSYNAGCYYVLIEGDNLEQTTPDVAFGNGDSSHQYALQNLIKTKTHIAYYTKMTNYQSDIQFRIWNNKETVASVHSIQIFYGDECK